MGSIQLPIQFMQSYNGKVHQQRLKPLFLQAFTVISYSAWYRTDYTSSPAAFAVQIINAFVKCNKRTFSTCCIADLRTHYILVSLAKCDTLPVPVPPSYPRPPNLCILSGVIVRCCCFGYPLNTYFYMLFFNLLWMAFVIKSCNLI